ncbi:T9SS type A sorting domain-containing protein [Crocinitomix sp.]|nr:T9SS type A sorting domain-containing protein [Crocinitomix sp.]
MKKIDFIKRVLALPFFILPTLIWSQTEVYDYTGSVQTYVVPLGVGSIQIDATGAAGGEGGDGIGGHGAQMIGTFSVTPGEVLTILVGEVGQSATYVGGGGGGTFVWNEDDELLIAAGGGGGAGHSDGADGFFDGIDASIDEAGTNGNGESDGGGFGGNGGTAPTATNYASGGAGWNTNGNNGTLHGCASNSTGGTRPLLGGAGGTGGGSGATIANGGYGGGGGGNARCGAVGGGGGGGYSGGGAGGEVVVNRYDAGGGGGSFNSGTDQENTEGVGTGNGQVIIDVMCTALLFEDFDTDICLDEEIVLDAMSVTGGTVMWSDGIENGVPFIPVGEGSHTYVATSTSGSDCSYIVEIFVHGLPPIVANADPETVCFGQELTLSGSGGAYYEWSPGDIENGEPFTPGLGTMTYTVIGEDWYGCFNTAEVTVDVVDAPVVIANATDDNLCLGESVTLTGSGAVTYEWDMGVEDGVSFTPETTGTFLYNVVGFVDGEGCFGEASIEITVNEVPTIDSYMTTEEVMGGDGSINITVIGGTPAYDFDWDNDGAGEFGDPEDLTGIAGGTYIVVVKDVNGCEDSETILVDSQAGIEDESTSLLTVYPNPTAGIIQINYKGVFSYQITAVNGEIIVAGNSVDVDLIDLSNLSNGIYFIRVNHLEGSSIAKVVKK